MGDILRSPILLSCCSKKSFVHSNQISIYIALPSFLNLFDVVFRKTKCLKKEPIANPNYSKLLILNGFSEAATKRNS